MKPSWIPFGITVIWLAFFISPFVNDPIQMLLCGLALLSFFGLGCWFQHCRSLEKDAK